MSELEAILRKEAEIHAQEARTANATIREIYEIVTGKTGEPGNWNGAEPVRKAFTDLRTQLADAVETLNTTRLLLTSNHFESNQFRLSADRVYKQITECLARINGGKDEERRT